MKLSNYVLGAITVATFTGMAASAIAQTEIQ